MKKTVKGLAVPKSEFTPYNVGIACIAETNIATDNFSRENIEYIGLCSINRREVAIGKIGNFWCVRGNTLETELKVQTQYKKGTRFKAYYIIKGRYITTLHSGNGCSIADFECRNTSKPLCAMTADEIFNAAKGKRSPKHGGKANSHADMGKYKNRPAVSLTAYGY